MGHAKWHDICLDMIHMFIHVLLKYEITVEIILVFFGPLTSNFHVRFVFTVCIWFPSF